MGVPTGGAQGRINIDITQLQAAQVAVQNASRQMTQALNSVSPAVQNAQTSVNSLAGGLRQLAGAFGIALGAQGVAQLARAAVAVTELTTAYNRQRVAAVSLAGSQAELNDLLATYTRVSGGSVSQVTALANVTNLLSVGFADSTAEIERFATAIRGISLARNVSQDFVTQNLILELFSQRGQRLDQLGLQYDAVRQAADKLQAADSNLTQEMAYQQAVLDQAIKRFGALVDSQEGQRSGLERLTDTWANFQLAVGKVISPLVNLIGGQLAKSLEVYIARLELVYLAAQKVGELLARTGLFGSPAAATGGSAPTQDSGRVTPARFREEQTAVITEWWQQTQEIERQANRERLDATRQYEEQRTATIRQYEQTIAREAQDFAIGRARAEEDYALGLERFRRDIAQREARQLEDLERTIADARTDAAERGSERQADLNERIADTRAESQERILELEADFAKRQERAQRSHARSLRDAVANLDAVRLRELQQDYRESQQEAQEDFDERLNKERTNEAKRLADLEKAHAKQNASEGAALEKRIRQAQDAYQRQLEDARAADEQRLTDQSADFALRQAREDEDRALRLTRLAEDHVAQLEEQARQHEARLIQIAEQEQDERDQLDEEFQKELAALGIRTEAYRDKLKGYEEAAIAAFDAVWAHMLGRMQGPQPLNPFVGAPGGIPSLTSPSVAPSNSTTNSSSTRSNTVNILPGAVSIVAPADLALDQRAVVWFHNMLADFFENQPQ